MNLASGTLVGDYVVEELVSQGGFAELYRARHVRTRQRVAIKVLHASLACVDEMLRRFELEAKILALLEHPNLVRYLAHGDLPTGQPFLVMEWVEGRTLDRVLRDGGAFTVESAVGVVRQLGGALAVAHAAGIVHRDLKALNVIVQPDGVVKLLDFGIAKHDQRLTSTGRTIGTPYAMAPEQLRGERDVDARVDIYALGVMMFQMVTARPPFVAADPIALGDLHLSATPPPSGTALDPVIARCMAKDRRDRWASVADLLAALPVARRATGLYVEARTTTWDDVAYDDLEAVLESARAVVAEHRLALELEAGDTIVASGATEDVTVVREAAQTLARRLTQRTGAHPGVKVAIRVRAAVEAGDLLRLGARLGDERIVV
jgi:serine/threonine-protein kinase